MSRRWAARRILLALALAAAPVWAAEWESGWESSFALPVGVAGAQGAPFAGLTARVGLTDLTALKLRISAGVGLRGLSEGEEAPSAMPWAGIELGRDFVLGGWIVLSPLLSAELRLPLDVSPLSPSLGLAGGVAVGVQLEDRLFLLLSGALCFSATGATPPFLALSVGMRKGLSSRGERPSSAAPPASPQESAVAEAAPAPAPAPEEQPAPVAVEPAPVAVEPAPVAVEPAPEPAPASAVDTVAEARPTWTLGRALFSPDEDGRDDTFVVDVHIDDPARVAAWRFEVFDDAGVLFHTTGGRGAPPLRLEWDGKSDGGSLVESAREYAVVLTLTEDSGEVVRLADTVLVDILVVKDGDRYRIRLPAIEFMADSDAVGEQSGAELLERNRVVLTKLAEILKRFPGYSIVVEGHANSVRWEDPEAAAVEQRDELIPLSLRRAQAVKDALVALGIEADRMATVGRGASVPLVPFSDAAESGRNRRVEIILVR